MNVTIDVYWDGCDGDNLACRPGHVAPGYEFHCWFVGRVLAVFALVNTVLLYYVAYLYAKAKKQNSKSTSKCGTQKRPSTEAWRVGSKRKHRNRTVLGMVLGSVSLAVSVGWFASIHGTQYPSTHILGIVGDFAAAIWFYLTWFTAHIQVRGACWFKGLVTLDGSDGNKPRTRTSIWSRLPTASKVIDTIEGTVVGLIFSLGLCTLVALGVLPRAWFFTVGYSINAITGARSFAVIARKRVGALRKVAVLQSEIRGTEDDKKRRRGILKNKTLALAIDLAIVFLANVVGNASVPLAGSAFSSRQFIFHQTIMCTSSIVLLFIFAINMYRKALTPRQTKQRSAAERMRGGSMRPSIMQDTQLSNIAPAVKHGPGERLG
jgi:hypothetical protein